MSLHSAKGAYTVDMENETFKLKLLLGIGAMFLISIYFSYGELKYATAGDEAVGHIVRTYKTRDAGRRRSVEKLAVEYRFSDFHGNSRKATDHVALDWPVPTDNKVTVQYRGDRSRLKGNANSAWVLIFFACLAALIGMVVKLWLETRAALRPTPRKAAKPLRY